MNMKNKIYDNTIDIRINLRSKLSNSVYSDVLWGMYMKNDFASALMPIIQRSLFEKFDEKDIYLL